MKKFLAILLLPLCCLLCACGTASADNLGITGEFYTVTEAYEKGYITRDDVMSIAYYHNGGRAGNESVMSEDYAPQSKTPEIPDAATDKAIKTSFYTSELWDSYKDYYSYEDITYGYFGTYGRALAIRIGVKGEAVNDSVYLQEIDGIKIDYRNGKRISIWIKK